MKKKLFKSFTRWLTACFFLVVMVMVFFIKIYEPNKFNPDADVCEEYGDKNIIFYPNECKHFSNDLCWISDCKSGTYSFSARSRFEYENCEKSTILVTHPCIKHRKKNECEKNNPAWIEETNLIVDTSIIGHTECELKSGWFCPAIGIVDLPCDENGNCYLKSGLKYVGCEHKQNVCLSKPTCRKKTNLELFKEKLNKYDCEKLALDFTEDCSSGVSNCKSDFYGENEDKLINYFILKGCKL